ncbi:MAG: ferric reductase-like transmembrane domain-containing protein [Burkholderiales bacterium]|jgi:predicted ferric reductase|nr:ferric reductase-like transmembrane domain-containing protein [Burkholderiales bacterium]
MKSTKTLYFGVLLVSVAFWAITDTLFIDNFSYFNLRAPMVQLSGIIAMVSMTVSMVLIARFRFINNFLPLKTGYQLHQWLGITALLSALFHWYWAQGSKWLVDLGILQKPERVRHAIDSNTLEGLFLSVREFAEHIGEWAFYVTAVLLIITLVKRIPRNIFKQTHKWLAALYLIFVFHSIILLKFSYWLEPMGLLMMCILILGTLSALRVMRENIKGALNKN